MTIFTQPLNHKEEFTMSETLKIITMQDIAAEEIRWLW